MSKADVRRKIRILHIGNVANYAYSIGKALQSDEVLNHVINWDYYHINSRPEWEEADFPSVNIGDHFFPRLPARAGKFTLPEWYAAGPRTLAILYLLALNKDRYAAAKILRHLERVLTSLRSYPTFRSLDQRYRLTRLVEWLCTKILRRPLQLDESPGGVVELRPRLVRVAKGLRELPLASVRIGKVARGAGKAKLRDGARRFLAPAIRLLVQAPPLKLAGLRLLHSRKMHDFGVWMLVRDLAQRQGFSTITGRIDAARLKIGQLQTYETLECQQRGSADKAVNGVVANASSIDQSEFQPLDKFDSLVRECIRAYALRYPERGFNETLLRQFKPQVPLMEKLFDHYDIVIAYAAEGIWPLMAGRPYHAYEFGTIRNLPYENSAMGRLTMLCYANADRTIVTNCDNKGSAERLQLDHFFLPHIVNEAGLPAIAERKGFRSQLEQQHGGDFFIFHPARQHWSEARDTNWDKGNDRFFRCFANLVKDGAVNVRCIAVAWGATLAESRALVEQLGIVQNVIWIDPQPHMSMMRYIAASDVVADQFTLKTFGGIPPKALYCGTPVVTAFDPEVHKWCFAEMPPFATFDTEDDLADTLMRLYRDPTYRRQLSEQGLSWYKNYNSNAVIRGILEREIIAPKRCELNRLSSRSSP